jgi:hypothetical protein
VLDGHSGSSIGSERGRARIRGTWPAGRLSDGEQHAPAMIRRFALEFKP